MTGQLDRKPDPDTAAAAQVAELVVNAAQLLASGDTAADSARALTTLLGATLGVRSARLTDRRIADRRTGDRRGRSEVAIPLPRNVDRRQGERRTGERRGDPPRSLVVELAEAGDHEWNGDDQRRRLESALAVIATAIGSTDTATTQLLRNTRLVIVRLGRDGWSVLSESVPPVLGYPRSLASQPLSIVDPRDRPAALRAFALARAGLRKESVVDLRVRSARGVTVVLETVFVDLTDVPGLRSVVAYGIDATRHHAERARLRQVVRGLAGAALVMDERGGLVLANEAFGRVFGDPCDGEAARRAVAARCREPESVVRRLSGFVSGRHLGTERLDLADGRVLDLELRPLSEGGTDLGTLWLFQDATSETTAERRGARPAVVSQELRAPATALLGFARLLADVRLGPLTENQRVAVGVVIRNTERLLRLVDDLALLNRLESGRSLERFAEVEVPALVRAAVAESKSEADSRGVEFECETGAGPPLRGESGLLRLVLAHALDNALRFAGAGDWVRVNAEFRENVWTVEVADSGVGTPSGEGLGLTVSREVVELHGGQLRIDNLPGTGTTVRIELPVQPVPHA